MKVINLKNYGVVVINTALTKEAIEKLSRHNPNALKLVDEEGNELFAICTAKEASVSEYGIGFDKMDSNGCALVTLSDSLENDELAEKYAGVLKDLKQVETNALAAYEVLQAELLEVANSIECPLDTQMDTIEEAE